MKEFAWQICTRAREKIGGGGGLVRCPHERGGAEGSTTRCGGGGSGGPALAVHGCGGGGGGRVARGSGF
jgi:hypothetical protein